MFKRAILTALLVSACGGNSSAPPELECKSNGAGEWRTSGPLRGACNVDTEHHVFAQHACYFDSGVRRYTVSNEPAAVEKECRALILQLVEEFCTKFPNENAWQASWTAFKASGDASTGSEAMYGTCRPRQVSGDEWSTQVVRL
jgi:hypothetical protein